MDPESGEVIANVASETALGNLDRVLIRFCGRGRILVNRLAFAPVMQNDSICMLDKADRLKVHLYISLYSSKAIVTRLFEPTLIIQMKGFSKLRLKLAKIDLSKAVTEIIDEQHVISLKPNEKNQRIFAPMLLKRIVSWEPKSRVLGLKYL